MDDKVSKSISNWAALVWKKVFNFVWGAWRNVQFASDNSAMMPSYTYRRTTMMKAHQVGQTKRRWIK